jgi:hypothetical protein
MKAQTVKEVLIATKYILEHTGWCQGTYYLDRGGDLLDFNIRHDATKHNQIGACCLSGAAFLVETDQLTLQKAREAISNIANQSIVGFNDKPGRTKKQVLAMLDKAIAAEK